MNTKLKEELKIFGAAIGGMLIVAASIVTALVLTAAVMGVFQLLTISAQP